MEPEEKVVLQTDIIEQEIQNISSELLEILLSDKTTKKYIRWGSDNYIDYGPEYGTDQQISPNLVTRLNSSIIQPRVTKADGKKLKRTRDHAEVFTPSWVCNEQNNLVDDAWFGRSNVFNTPTDHGWRTNPDPVAFPRDKIWKDYIDARRLEISCGEAPYLVSRYDAVTGERIPIHDRIGLLDRKLRIVGENAMNFDEWYQWTIRAFQSVYGYDFQGDNVLLARENLLYTFVEYMEDWAEKEPDIVQMKKIANIISWNIWQMNGLTMTAPYSLAEPAYHQVSLFELYDMGEAGIETEEPPTKEMLCRIYDWRSKESVEFKTVVMKG